MFTPPPKLALAEDFTSSPKRRRLDSEVEENKNPNAPGSAPVGGGTQSSLSAEQRARIEQSRLAALERKQQKGEISCTQDIDADQRARIEQNRLAALARKQQREQAQNPASQDVPCPTDIDAEKRARIEQNRLAALARKQQKAAECEQVQKSGDQEMSCTQDIEAEKRNRIEQNRLAALARKQQRAGEQLASTDHQKQDADGAESSASPSTPALSSAPSTPSSESLLCADDSDSGGSPSDVSSLESDSSSSDSSSSSSDSTSDSSSDSDTEVEQQSAPPSSLTPAQLAKIAQNRRAALARKNGITPEQFARMEENRRRALARKRGFNPEQIARMEENRRKAIERKQQKLKATVEPQGKEEMPKEETAAGNDADSTGVPAPKPVEERDARQKLVAQLLCRWWFALPPWPPENFDSDAEISRLGFRRVALNTFDQEEELDVKGFRKAYELEQFKGCFRTSDGRLLDVRPKEGRPSYDQFMLKSTPDLYRLLIAAFDAQLIELFNETQKEGATKELEEHLVALRKEATKVRQKALFYLSFAPKKKGAAKT